MACHCSAHDCRMQPTGESSGKNHGAWCRGCCEWGGAVRVTQCPESEEVSSIGLYQIETFAVDVEGNIYILNLRSEENHIFKFGPDGQFAKSFGKHGQDPEELLREVILNRNIPFVRPLSNGNFVNPTTPIDAVAQRGRFYYVREKETGFKQFTSCREIPARGKRSTFRSQSVRRHG